MNSKRDIKTNYIYNLFYQVLSIVAPLITTPYLSRVLGPDGIGKISYAESIVAYFVLFAAIGIQRYGQREVSYVQDDIEKKTLVFWNTKALSLITSLVVLAVYIPFALSRDNRSMYLVLSLNIINVIADVSWFFQGLEEFKKIITRNAFIRLINIGFIFLFVKQREDILIYVIWMTSATLLCSVSLWPDLKSQIKIVSIKRIKPFHNFYVVLSLFIPTIAIEIYTVLDKTMIGVITNNAFQNGYYEQAMKMSKMVLAIITALGTVMLPRIGSLFQEGNIEAIKTSIYRSYRFVWMISIPMCFGLMITSNNFVPWYFGKDYDEVIPLLHILSFLIIIIGISNVTGVQYLIPVKKHNSFTLTVVVGALVNFCMNVAFIRSFQAIGAAIASVIAETTVTVIQLIIVRRELRPLEIIKLSRNYYGAVVPMIVVLLLENHLLDSSFLHTTIMIFSGAVVYCGILLLLRDELVVDIMRTILDRIKK